MIHIPDLGAVVSLANRVARYLSDVPGMEITVIALSKEDASQIAASLRSRVDNRFSVRSHSLEEANKPQNLFSSVRGMVVIADRLAIASHSINILRNSLLFLAAADRQGDKLFSRAQRMLIVDLYGDPFYKDRK